MKRLHRFRLATVFLFLLATGLLIAGFAHSSGVAHADPPIKARSIGIFMNGFPEQGSALLDQYTALTGGIQPQVGMWFQRMDQPFNVDYMNAFTDRGIVPMVTMSIPNGISNDEFIAGASDRLLRAYARAAADWGKPFFFRFNHEYNGNWYSFSLGAHTRKDGTTYTNTPENFIAAWRHMHDIFRAEGAVRVKFVFNPNDVCAGACFDFASSYPGDDYVDWVGLDSYNFGFHHPLSGWFNMNKPPEDWGVNSSDASLAAWNAVVSSPAWQGRLNGDLHPIPRTNIACGLSLSTHHI
jgi:hypothetical protein